MVDEIKSFTLDNNAYFNNENDNLYKTQRWNVCNIFRKKKKLLGMQVFCFCILHYNIKLTYSFVLKLDLKKWE